MSTSVQKRPDDPRLRDLISTSPHRAEIVILGFPFDLGVVRNHGRAGASKAPALLREFLLRLTPDVRNFTRAEQLGRRLYDRGDLKLARNIGKAQDRLGSEVAGILRAGQIPIILGGGHETSYGHFLGYVYAKKPVQVVNLDAHPDVRPRISGVSHSGSSFRDALTHPSKLCNGYIVAGLQPQSSASAHLKFIDSRKNSSWIWGSDCNLKSISKLFKNLKTRTMVSIDMDCVNQAFAPGVSAPNSAGLTPEILLHFAKEAGQSPWVSSLDLVEVNPKYDRDFQTSRLAALAIWSFLSGLALRKKTKV